MSSGAIAIIILAVVVIAAIAVIVAISGRTASVKPESESPTPTTGLATNVRGRAKVANFHVHGNEARVTFDIPTADTNSEVVAALLSDQAIEVVREKRHSLPIDDVEQVVVYTGGKEPVELTRVRLNKPGELPDPGAHIDVLDLSTMAADPLTKDFASSGEVTAAPTPTDDALRPLSQELDIPPSLRAALQAQGVDMATMKASDLVTGLLAVTGYQIGAGPIPGTLFATKPGSLTFIAFDEYNEGDYHEVNESTIQRFAVDSQSSNADRSVLVTEKYAPFSVYQLEKRRSDLKILSRERLQAFVNATALG
ncbi:MAG: hypothetical protein GEU79_03835 [Acidimicrobiia bacterium]|nr:hypothetical protein [Acidimicrobiia bacterium]